MSLKTILTLVVPGGVVLGTAAAALLLAPETPVLLQAARGYPYAALAAALLLAWRLQRSRLFIAALALATVPVVLRQGDVTPLALATTFLPPGLALLALTADRSITAPRARLQFALAFGPLQAAVLFALARPKLATELLTYELVDPLYTSWSAFPQPGLFASILALLMLGVTAAHSRRAPDAGLAWMALATILALAASAGSVARAIWVLAGAIVLIVALVESSYVMAFHDDLTGLPGRRALKQTLGSLQPPYAVAAIDIDHFKKFNDRYGHDVGDQVLRMVATKLATVGGGGSVFRSGGEEFTIVFPETTKDGAALYLEAVRRAVAEAHFTVRSHTTSRRGKKKLQQRLRVTISIGVASSEAASRVEAVLKSADNAMYRAKSDGRNRVVT